MKKKVIMRVVSLLICVVLTAVSMPFARAEESTKTNYPYVFVHGMMGWGNYDSINGVVPYWGMANGDMIASLREQGYTCYEASVGKISSNWDRACELYAQLTGTVVDYGEAHSKACGHSRFGRSYEGNALMPDFGKKDENGDLIKINLFGHSMGGPTVRLFTWLLENGCEEEIAASGENVSEFFKGGKGEYVYSVTTWSAPHNGSPASNTLYDKLPTAYILATMGNILGISPTPALWDFQLEQFGLTAVPSQGIKAYFNILGILRLVKSDDNCGYDLSLRGAKKLNDMIDIVDGIYYFSYTGEKVDKKPDGTYRAQKDMIPLFTLISNRMGRYDGEVVDGIVMDETWRENDGIVPVISGRVPFDEEYVEFDKIEKSDITTGVWVVMPVIDNFSHVSYMGMDTSEFQYLYENQMELINSL